ncbi:MAG: nucleoside-diphosphate kinase, partial [Chloroflexi bacterium]
MASRAGALPRTCSVGRRGQCDHRRRHPCRHSAGGARVSASGARVPRRDRTACIARRDLPAGRRRCLSSDGIVSAERTLVVLKPDALQRGIAFELLSRFEKRGLRFAALRLLKVDRAMAEKHYTVHKGKFFYDDLVGVITASPVVAAVLEGPNAIAVVRAMVGSTRPHEASEGSIRGDYALVGLRNLVHASDAPDTAASEIKLWFPDGVVEYTRDIDRWMTED